MKRTVPLSRLLAVGGNHLIKVLALIAIGTCVAWAGSICPGGSGIDPFPHSPDSLNTGCNVVITIHADLSVSSVVMDSEPYENSEDALVGVQNNSSSRVSSLTLTGTDIFGLDGDGICTFTFVGSGYCSANGASQGTDPYDYYGPTTTFTNLSSANTGTVNFNPAIPPGGSAYFSLEGVPTANLVGTVGATTPTAAAPALSVWALALLGGLLMGCSVWMIRKKARQAQACEIPG